MAATALTTNDPLAKKTWDEMLFRDGVKEAYFSKFMGNSADSLVHVKTMLEKSQGDKITFGIRKRLVGSGVTGDSTLEGNEEALTTHDDSVSLEQYRHAVRTAGQLTEKRAMFDIDEESTSALKDWGAEKLDSLAFDAIQATPSIVGYIDGTAGAFDFQATAATAKTALSAANSKITPNFVSFLKSWAMNGGARSYTPLRPVKVKGKSYFILLVSNDVMYDLKTNSAFQTALREAQVRGDENPLFNGAAAIWDGVVIHEHENIANFTNGGAGANVPGSTCVFMGAQSLIWAWGKRPTVVQKEFDYDNQQGYAWGFIAATKKPKFDDKDYGSIGVYVARTQVSDS